MKRVWLLVLLLSLGLNVGLGYVLLTGGGPATDQRGRGQNRRAGRESRFQMSHPEQTDRWHKMMERRFARLTRELGLDAHQTESMKGIRTDAMPEIHSRQQAIFTARQRLHQACLGPDATRENVQEEVRNLVDVQGRLDSLVAEILLKEMDLLTPEQREKYLDAMPWEPGGSPRGRPGPPRPDNRTRDR